MAKEKPLSDELLMEKARLYVTKAPLIGHPGWMHLLKSEHFIKTAIEHRIKEAMNCVKEEVATEYEALLYLHTASLAAPFSTEWYRIFFHLFDKFYGHLAPQDLKFNGKLSDDEERSLLDLRKWIFDKQMKAISDDLKALKKKSKKQKKVKEKDKEQPQQTESTKKAVTVTLSSFF